MENFLNLVLQASSEATSKAPGGFDPKTIIMLLMIIVVFYFFMILPQSKKQKELKNFRNSLAKGDKVVTTGGIYGKIVSTDDVSVTIDVGNDVKLRIDKNAIIKDPSDLAQPQKK